MKDACHVAVGSGQPPAVAARPSSTACRVRELQDFLLDLLLTGGTICSLLTFGSKQRAAPMLQARAMVGCTGGHASLACCKISDKSESGL